MSDDVIAEDGIEHGLAKRDGIRVAEAFAGVGGFSVGFGDANKDLGRDVYETVWANQWEPDGRASKQFAWECYERHYGKGSCINEDVSSVLDDVASGNRELPEYDLLCGGFPCFPAGRLVLTGRGFIPIEDVRVGDMAYTHRGRWRRVTDVMRHVADSTVLVHGEGDVIECTPNHKFWARAWQDVADSDATQDEPDWIRADDLAGSMWLTTSASNTPVGKDAVPPLPERDVDDAFWHEVGMWLGIGSVVSRDGRLAVDMSDGVDRPLVGDAMHTSGSGVPSLAALSGESGDAFCAWLARSFGSRRQGRHLPVWVFGMPRSARSGLLLGWLDACASRDGSWYYADGVPYALAVGLRVLAAGLGMSSSIGVVSHAVCGFSCSVGDGDVEVCGDGVWSRVGSVTEGRRGIVVYNITVDEDHSYTVDGVVVKNCQAFSVARSLSKSPGLDDVPGGKGVLWWQLDRMIRLSHPKWCLFENVDRLLKSPASNRGRDFATILACLADCGYDVEWRVVNAADYGNPQRRRRVFIFCSRNDLGMYDFGAMSIMMHGVMAKALPMEIGDGSDEGDGFLMLHIPKDPSVAFADDWTFGKGSPFRSAGAMTSDGSCCTCDYVPVYDGKAMTLGDVLLPIDEVPEPCFVRDADIAKWEYTRSAKHIPRVDANGHEYVYSEGAMCFPDRTDVPSRTILTAGGHGASRMKHIIATGSDEPDRRYRLLAPVELERLQRFPDGWTEGMSESHRVFCMGNALVTDIPRRIGIALANYRRMG